MHLNSIHQVSRQESRFLAQGNLFLYRESEFLAREIGFLARESGFVDEKWVSGRQSRFFLSKKWGCSDKWGGGRAEKLNSLKENPFSRHGNPTFSIEMVGLTVRKWVYNR